MKGRMFLAASLVAAASSTAAAQGGALTSQCAAFNQTGRFGIGATHGGADPAGIAECSHCRRRYSTSRKSTAVEHSGPGVDRNGVVGPYLVDRAERTIAVEIHSIASDEAKADLGDCLQPYRALTKPAEYMAQS